MSLYNPSRDQVRQFFFDSWAKFKQQTKLTDLEKIAVEVMQMHPEYHAVLDAPQRYLQQQWTGNIDAKSCHFFAAEIARQRPILRR